MMEFVDTVLARIGARRVVFAWSAEGTVLRDSNALAPLVCLLAGGVVLSRDADSAPGRAT